MIYYVKKKIHVMLHHCKCLKEDPLCHVTHYKAVGPTDSLYAHSALQVCFPLIQARTLECSQGMTKEQFIQAEGKATKTGALAKRQLWVKINNQVGRSGNTAVKNHRGKKSKISTGKKKGALKNVLMWVYWFVQLGAGSFSSNSDSSMQFG